MIEALKAGYKRTEVGLIPEDWDVRILASICARITTGKLDANAMVESGDYPFFTCAREHYWINSFAFDTEALLVSGNGANVGYIHHYAGKFNAYQRTYVITGINSNVRYVKLFLEKNLHARLRTEVNAGNTPYIVMGTLAQLNVTLPPQAEQQAIAEALSDSDALIESLDQLIAKKRDLKQGAMQELLTGKRRLPGFGGEWEVRRLGDVLKVRHGRSQRGVEVSGGMYPILASGGEIGRADNFLYNKPSVLIGRKGTIDKPRYQSEPFWTVDTLFYTEVFSAVDPKFIYYQFLMVDWRAYNEASGVPSLNASTIEAVEIDVPKLSEQTAIATILSDMDTELAELQVRLAKARQIKQGMMQELLTGRIRLL